MYQYDNVTEALKGLKERGYTEDFNLAGTCIQCAAIELQLNPEEFSIDEYHRFEGSSNPSDSSIVYAISSTKGLKGVMVDAYGVYADSLSPEMIAKLNVNY